MSIENNMTNTRYMQSAEEAIQFKVRFCSKAAGEKFYLTGKSIKTKFYVNFRSLNLIASVQFIFLNIKCTFFEFLLIEA